MINMMDGLVCWVVVLVLMADLLNIPSHYQQPVNNNQALDDHRERAGTSGQQAPPRIRWSLLQLVEAKGVAGLGKAGGDGSAGADKSGQQVPPEVYNALTYAGSAFLLTLSIPVILYTLNKLLNVIEDCFGCGPASRRASQNEKTKLADKRKKRGETMIKDMTNQLTSTTAGHMSHLLLNEKQKLFHDLNGNLAHSIDINSHHTQSSVHNNDVGNNQLQNSLPIAKPTTTAQQQELLLNPLTVLGAHSKGSMTNLTGSVHPSSDAMALPVASQMIQNFQQQFIIS